MSATSPTFDAAVARARCARHRRRILEVSQRVPALHIGGAFSCLEIVDAIYFGLMTRAGTGESADTFVLSKGHGALSQYVVLEALGVLPASDLDTYCTPHGRLGVHPDYGTPGIEAATGSLGHGLAMAVGMALAGRGRGTDGVVYVVLSDGELQEGSTWEAVLMASSLHLNDMVVVVDNNDFQSFGRTSVTHTSLYPIDAKFRAFGWDAAMIDGHDPAALVDVVRTRGRSAPLAVVARTVKGKGVSFMESAPIWHYRSPSPEEYAKALAELERDA